MSNKSSSYEEDTTQDKETVFNTLADQAKSVIPPIMIALRKQANGHEADMDAAITEARERFANFISLVAPAKNPVGTGTLTPTELIDGYWQSMTKKGNLAPTGIESLDKVLSGGLEQDRLVTLMGAPGSGKTTFANQIVNHAADAGRPVLYVTSEDSPMALLAKTIARRGEIDYSAVLYGWQDRKPMIDRALANYREQKSARLLRYMDATSRTTLATIAEQAHKHFKTHEHEATGAPILVIDYLQNLATAENLGPNIRESVSIYATRLKDLAKDLHCTVIALCSMNRSSSYHIGNSTIASAKESGDIEYTSHVMLAIGERLDSDGTPVTSDTPWIRKWMLRVDKNRQGVTTYNQGHIYLDWEAARQKFTESERDEDISSDSRPNGRRGRR